MVGVQEVLDVVRYIFWSDGSWGVVLTNLVLGGKSAVGSAYLCPFMSRTIHDVALTLDREQGGRDNSPTSSVLKA